jgi:glyoxylase-like metal-dependent hydrolase (beta-lactamase superfamily II)
MPECNLTVHHSGIWQTTSAMICSGRSCLVVDPAYFPQELQALVRAVPRAAAVEALAFTHSHWDHVVGHGAFPCVPVYVSSALAHSVAEGGDPARTALTRAREFDGRWYVDRPWGYRWPEELRGLDDEGWFNIGDLDVQALMLPGHAPDCMGLRAENFLLVGDYLSPCEIPFVDDPAEYRRTLRRLLIVIDAGIEVVVPGHGPVLTASQARGIAIEDLHYIDALLRCAAAGDAEAALAIPLPRAADAPGMRDHHLENCRTAGLGVPAPAGPVD